VRALAAFGTAMICTAMICTSEPENNQNVNFDGDDPGKVVCREPTHGGAAP
jgi:hypothetical protein